MPETVKILEFTGHVDYSVIDHLLDKLKEEEEFFRLRKVTAKRIYAIVVECLENIAKYSVTAPPSDKLIQPSLSVCRSNNVISIITRNLVTVDIANEIIEKLDRVNHLNGRTLNALFEHEISKERNRKKQGAGLGFILMKLRSRNDIDYKFTEAGENTFLFELTVKVNE